VNLRLGGFVAKDFRYARWQSDKFPKPLAISPTGREKRNKRQAPMFLAEHRRSLVVTDYAQS
jgi:hypothetical protein